MSEKNLNVKNCNCEKEIRGEKWRRLVKKKGSTEAIIRVAGESGTPGRKREGGVGSGREGTTKSRQGLRVPWGKKAAGMKT